MKALLISLIFLLGSNYTTSDHNKLNNEVTVNGRTFLYGEINREGLTSGTYKNWFTAYYNAYKPDMTALKQCNEQTLEGITVKVLMATWCGDSKRNVPVFYKVMDSLGFEESKLQVWALDSRKRGPNNEQIQYGVTRVPTIIFYRDDVEIGRFVERLRPGQRMEDVMVQILSNP